MAAACDGSLLGLRDRTLLLVLLVGFAGAFRRSELVGLDRAHARLTAEGLQVTLRRSKTDQERGGPTGGDRARSPPGDRPVAALEAWLAATGVHEGALFRGLNRQGHLLPGRLSNRGLARVVKARADAAGLDPACYAGHSLCASPLAGDEGRVLGPYGVGEVSGDQAERPLA